MITLIADNKYKLFGFGFMFRIRYGEWWWCCNGSQFVNSSDLDTMASNKRYMSDMNVNVKVFSIIVHVWAANYGMAARRFFVYYMFTIKFYGESWCDLVGGCQFWFSDFRVRTFSDFQLTRDWFSFDLLCNYWG